MTVSDTGKSCEKDEDCNMNGDIRCGLCSRKGYCVYPFHTVFKPTSLCEYVDDNCHRSKCQNVLPNYFKPYEGYGTCVCVCYQSFYGQLCEKKGDLQTGYTTGVQLISPTVVNYSEYFHVFILIEKTGYEAYALTGRRNVTMVLRLSNGMFIAQLEAPISGDDDDFFKGSKAQKYCLSHSTDKNICQFFFPEKFDEYRFGSALYEVDIKLPFHYDSHGGVDDVNDSLYYGDTYSLKLDMLNPKETYYMPIVVRYPEDLENVPIIDITNCAKSFYDPTIYNRDDEMFFGSEVYFVEDYLLRMNQRKQSEIQYQWMIFMVEKDKQYSVPDSYFLGKSSLRIEPYSLKEGTYIVKLVVRNMKHNPNFDQCYAKVVLRPLVARISGGSWRYVNAEDGIVLDASNSRDPNEPPEKQNLTFLFNCKDSVDPVCLNYTTTSKNYKPFVIGPNILQPNKNYTCTLIVEAPWSEFRLERAVSYQNMTVEAKDNTAEVMKYLEIECVYNCETKSKPQDLIYLKIKGSWKVLKNMKFQWSIEEKDILPENGKSASAPNKTVTYKVDNKCETFSYKFILPEDELQHNKEYSITAKIPHSRLFAVYTLSTTPVYEEYCAVEPSSGIAGVTVFQITCYSTGKQRGRLKRCILYNKNKHDELGFGGRTFSFQRSCSIKRVLLTREIVEVTALKEFGGEAYYTAEVKLNESTLTVGDIEKMVSELKVFPAKGNAPWVLRKASVIPDVLKSEMGRGDILEDVLGYLSRVPLESFEDGVLCLSTLHNILMTLYNWSQVPLSLEGARNAASVLLAIGNILESTRGIAEIRHTTFLFTRKLFSHLLDCVHVLLQVRNEEMIRKSTIYTDPVISLQVKETAQYIIQSLSRFSSVLIHKYLPQQTNNLITSNVGNVSIWVKVDTPEALRLCILKYKLPLSLSENLSHTAEEMEYYLGLAFTSLDQSPFWWRQDINTNSYFVCLCIKKDWSHECKYLKRFTSGIQLVFSISDIVDKIAFVEKSVTQLDRQQPRDLLDLNLTVLRIYSPPQSAVQIEVAFNTGKEDQKWSLKVVVRKDSRPDFEMFEIEGLYQGILGNETHMFHGKPEEEPYNHEHFYYMALLPSSRVPMHITLTFRIKVYNTLCRSWHGRSETGGCKVLVKPTEGRLICECSHLSLFAGSMSLLPISPDPFEEFPIASHLRVGLTLLPMCLLLLILVFMLLYIFVWRMDKRDEAKKHVVILSDNYPGESYSYLVCVKTGARLCAGTGANVGIRLCGSSRDSRVHILRREGCRVMEWMGEDWFLLYIQEHLGTLRYLHIWHDDSGKKPYWFCGSVLVYDLSMEVCYRFLIGDWISLTLETGPDVTVMPTRVADIFSVSRVFLDVFTSCLHTDHLWLNTVVRHARDPILRTDRLLVILCFIVVSMLTCLGIIRLDDKNVEVDFESYSLTWREVLLSLPLTVISASTAWILLTIFRKSHRIVYHGKMRCLDKKCSCSQGYCLIRKHELLSNGYQRFLEYGHEYFCFERKELDRTIWGAVILFFLSYPLAPIQLPGDTPNIITNKSWLICAWIACLVVVAVCVFLCLWLASPLATVKTQKWFTVVLLSVIVHALWSTLRILSISVLVALTCNRLIYIDVPTFDAAGGQQAHLLGNRDHLKKVVEARLAPEYVTLSTELQEKHRQILQKRSRQLLVLELLLTLSLLAVLSGMLGWGRDILTQYHSNSHVRHLLGASRTGNTPHSYGRVSNQTQYEEYLKRVIPQHLFKYLWYNMKSLSQVYDKYHKKHWFYDNTCRTMGSVRMRQYKVRPGHCTVPGMMINVTGGVGCAAPWGWLTEDTDEYIVGWIKPEEVMKDEFLRHLQTDKILYTKAPVDANFYYYGSTGYSYHPGGYVFILGADRYEMEDAVAYMKEEAWLGHYTRAVLVQTTVYNANTRLFTEAIMVAEQTVAGEYLTAVQVHSVEVRGLLNMWMFPLLMLIGLLCVRFYISVNYKGVLGVLKSFRRLYDALMLLVACYALFYLLKQHITGSAYVKSYQLNEKDTYFVFFRIATFYFNARTTLCIVFALAVLRAYALCRFEKLPIVYFNTFKHSLCSIFYTSLVYILCFKVLWTVVRFATFSIIITVRVSLTVVYRNRNNHLDAFSEYHFIISKVIHVLVLSVNFIFVSLLVSIFRYEYKITNKIVFR